MAIRKVIRIKDGIEQEVLGLDDILEQIGGNRGDSIDFIGLASVLDGNIDLNGNLILPDTFVGKNLNLNATQPFSATPSIITFNSVGDSRTLNVSTSGTYRISSFPNWVSIDRTFAKGASTFLVSASPNNNLNSPSREGTIVFSAGSELASVTVSQGGNPITATITPNTNQTISSSANSDSIVVKLSDTLSINSVSITNNDGFTLSQPSISTANSIVSYTYTLEWSSTDLARSTTFQLLFSGEGFNDIFEITYNQQAFTPLLDNIDPTSLSFPSSGQTLSYSFQSNTSWTATISSPSFAFQHSLQSDRNFTTNPINGTGNDTIYVRIGGNAGNSRIGTSSVTTTYSRDNVTQTVNLSQAAADSWDENDITITGFAVADNGDVTEPTITTTGDVPFTVEYSTGYTSGTPAGSYPLVDVDTTRTVTVSVTVPTGYLNTGDTFTKSVSVTQVGLPTFKSSQITLGTTRLFAVSIFGGITTPNVSVPTGITATLRYTTGDNNTGTAYTTFPKVGVATTRYANAVVVVPQGYFNEGDTVIKTVSAEQPLFDPTLSIETISLAFVIGGETLFFDVVSNHSWVSSLTNLGDAAFEQSLSSTSGFTTNDISGNGSDRIYIKAPKNLGESKVGTISVGTNFGTNDNSDSVILTQEGEPTFAFSDWTGTVSVSSSGVVSVTKGNSLTTPTIDPTSFAKVSVNTSRDILVTITVPDGYNNHNSEITDTKTVTQPKFVPSISASPASRSFTSAGGTTYYDVTSNTTWEATIEGAGFEHSTSSTTGFKTTAITGTSAGDRIYVRAPLYEGTGRLGTSTVTTTQGFGDVSDTVDLDQAAAPKFVEKDITIGSTTAFDVNSYGLITAPNVSTTNDLPYTISYTTGDNSGTAYTTSFPKVSIDTTRYCNVSVTIPSGYQSSGTVVTKTVSAIQEDFDPTLSIATIGLDFGILGETLSFGVVSNYTWVSSITNVGGASFEQSLDNVNFTTNDLNGSGDDVIFIKAPKNVGENRTGAVNVSTNFGHLDNTDGVLLSQEGRPTYTFSQWNGTVSISSTGGVSATLGSGDGAVTAVSTDPTSFALVSVATDRNVVVTLTVPTGYNNSGGTVSDTITVSQPYFDPTLSIATTSLAFVIGGAVKSFVVSSNYNWTSTISGTGFEQSLVNADANFTTNAIDGNGNDTIYIRALANAGEDRTGTVSLATTFTNRNNSDSVSLSQVGEPTFGIGDWDGVVSISSTGVVSATKGNSLTTPSFTPTSFAKVSVATNRTVSVTVKAPDGYNNHNSLVTGDVTVSQPYFDPTLSIAVADLTFTNTTTEQVKYFDVVSNHSWVSTLTNDTGAKFRQSLSSTTGFTTNDLNGSGNDRIYIKALVQDNDGDERTGSVSVATDFANRNNSDSVTLKQNASPTWTSSNISVTGFDVNADGVITQPTITTTGTSITTTYTYGSNTGTAVTAAAGFPLVSTNTTRYCNVTATAPAGYRNATTAKATKTVSAIQEEKFYGSDEISITGFAVASDGTVTEPTISATGVQASNITITYDLGDKVLPGNTPGYYPPVLTDRARSVTASVTVPSGWYNSTETQSRTATDIQEATTLSGHIFQPYTSTVERTIFEIGGVGGDYTLSNFWSATETATKYLSFSLRTNVAASYTVLVSGIGGSLRTGPYFNTNIAEYTFSSQSTYNTTNKPEHFRVYITAPSAGGSRRISVMLNTTTVTGKNLTFDIVATRTASSGTGGTKDPIRQ